MKKTYSTADQLMEHLKHQIIRYPEKAESVDKEAVFTYVLKNENTSIDLETLENELYQNTVNCNISTEFYIDSHRRGIGKIIVFGKKLVRKLLRWYIDPPFKLQSNFNGSVTRSLNESYNLISLLLAKQQILDEKVTSLGDELSTTKQELLEAKKKLNAMNNN